MNYRIQFQARTLIGAGAGFKTEREWQLIEDADFARLIGGRYGAHQVEWMRKELEQLGTLKTPMGRFRLAYPFDSGICERCGGERRNKGKRCPECNPIYNNNVDDPRSALLPHRPTFMPDAVVD